MNENKQGRRPPRRFRRHSTKKRSVFRPPAHPGRLAAIVLAAVAVIVLALVWGNALKRQSDAYRADKEAGRWTLSPETPPARPSTAAEVHLLEIKPEGNVGDIFSYKTHDGVLLPLRDADGSLYYLSEVASEAGISVPADAIALEKDVARVSKRPLHVSGIFHVTCFDAPDTATQTYRRGLELALLCEYAASGINDILLVGLPAGSETDDRRTVAFLEELNTLLASLSDRPAIGVALPLSALENDSDEPDVESDILAGELSPGRIGRVSDYLALDLRDVSAEAMDTLLPRLGYAYQRHSLRMMVDRAAPAVAEDLRSHGFDRVFEMRTDEP